MANLTDTSVNGDLRVTGTMFGTQAGNYATCATAGATAAKTATISGFTLTTGIHVFVKFTVTNTAAVASLTLNVSDTGAKAMKYRGGNLPAVGTLSASRVYEFIYDGTNWELVGDLDTNTQTVTGVKGNAESSYRTGQVNLTAANIGASASDHTHGNIGNGGTLTDTAAAAAGNDYVVIRDADNAKIQTSTIKGTDVADAVSKKHSHSTLTLSTTAQAYDGSHTLALPSADPYTSARTPASHTHGNITNGGALQTNDITIANGDKLVVTDSSDSNKVARASISFDGSTATKALTQKGTWETFNNYSLPLAASGTRGGIQIGYSESGTNYAVKLSSEKAYVTVPWTDTKVKATAKTDNVNYKILATASASPTSGNATEAVYDTDISLNPSTNTITANVSGNSATSTALAVSAISYHRPTSSTGSTADGKQWCRLGTLTDTAVTEGAQWFGVGVLFNVYSNPYGPVRTHFGCFEFSFRIGIAARAEGAAAYSLKTSGDMTIQKLYGPDVPASADGRTGIDFRIVRSDTKVELFIKNSVWDSTIYVERFRQINGVGSYGTWEWSIANGLYTDDEFATYCSDKTVKYLTKKYEFRANLADSTTWNNFYNSYKEVTFGSSITYETFCAACTTADSFAYKTFGDTLDTTEKTINAIGRLNLSSNSAIQTGIGLTDGYPMFHVVATRQAGYMDISSGSTIVRYKFSRYGALSNKVTISTGDTKVTQTADNSSTGTGFEVLFSATADNTTRTEDSRKSSKLTFQPSTGTLTATKFSGPLTGNVTGNCSGSSGSCTGNAATATSAGKLTTARKAYVTLGTASTTTTVDWSADPTTIPVNGTLPIANGGTGATTKKAAEYAINGGMTEATAALADNFQIVFSRVGTDQSATNGVFIYRQASTVWNYMKGKMSSDTGVNISGNAATATTATNSTNSAVTADTTHQLYLIGATGSSGQQALKTDTGIYATATAGQLHATTFDVNSKCTLQFNTTTNALDFVFA